MRILAQAAASLGLEWSTPEQPAHNRLDGYFLPGERASPASRPAPFLPELHEEVAKSWNAPFSARMRSSVSLAFSAVDDAKNRGYHSLPPVEEAIAAHLCPPSAGRRAKLALPSKACRMTSTLLGRAFSAAGQAASALHTMATLQIFQADLLRKLDENGPDAICVPDLRSATDLALRATKSAAQAIGRSMASLTVTERHLWLTLSEMSESERAASLTLRFLPLASSELPSKISRKDYEALPAEALQFCSRPCETVCSELTASASAHRRHFAAPTGPKRETVLSLIWPPPRPVWATAQDCGKARGPEVVLARLGKRRCSSPAAAGLPPKLIARSVPRNVTVPVYFAVNKPVPLPACLHTNAVFTATQINPIKSVFSGVPATADGVMSVDKMPTAQCPFLHTSTARHTGLAHIKSTQFDCALNVADVPTAQCPQSLRPACLEVSVKTKPTCIRSAQADNALGVVNVPAIPRPHPHTDMTSPTGLAQPSPSRLTTAEEPSTGNLPAVISAPSASNVISATLVLQHTEAPLSLSDQSALSIQPLAIHADAWARLPGVSKWVLDIIKRGYSLQFRWLPRRYATRVETMVKTEVAHLLRAEILKLLSKGAIEPLSLAQSKGGLYSRYFLVPKKDGGLRPILDLRQLNRVLAKRQFRMLTTRKILAQIRRGDWFVSIDLKDAYFQIQIASRHRRYLRFAFEGQAYQYTVLPFGLSLAPRTFKMCMDAALAPLRLQGMRVLNYLDDWLILAQSHSMLIEHRTILLDHLENLGLRVNWAKSSLSPREIISFLTARLSPQRVLDIQCAASSFRCGASVPLKKFQRMLGLMASASSVLQLGLLRMRPLQFWLKARVPRQAWASGLLRLKVNQKCIAVQVKPGDFLVKVVSTDANGERCSRADRSSANGRNGRSFCT
ncbi:hypothetical protein PO909_029676 [Leuciscus waleckii]